MYRLSALVVLLLLPLSHARAQMERYQLTREMRAFDRVLAEHSSPEERRRAVPHLQKALFAIFLGQNEEATRQFVRARLALLGTVPSARPIDPVSSETSISVVPDLKNRLSALRDGLAALPKSSSTDRATLEQLVALLRQLADGRTLDTDYPAARLLREAEELLAALKAGKPYHGRDRPGEFWMSLAVPKGPAPVRALIPEAVRKGKPVPLVIALHGAGGSENSFFDCYGDGLIARLCAKRGWLLVCPRDGLKTGVIDEITRLYPVDAERIYLVGHSQGAAQAVAAAGRTPERFAAVALLGGSGGFADHEGLKTVSFFVGVGADDFALPGVRSLHANLARNGVRRNVLKVYPDVEHLMVVPLALPEVFAFFDEAHR
jgi:dienelactone hydrolase